MMPFTVLRRFSGSDYLLPGLEEQDRQPGIWRWICAITLP